MILFFFDQIASAQYVAPLLKNWISDNRSDWLVLATSQSAKYLQDTSIPFKQFEDLSESGFEPYLNSLPITKALLSTSIPNLNEQKILKYLRLKKIPTAQLVDNWINLTKRFEYIDEGGSRLMLFPDRIYVLDEYAKKHLLLHQAPENIIQIIGQPYWEDWWRSHQDKPATLFPKQAGLVITQPISKFFGTKLGYDEFSFIKCCIDSWMAAGFDLQNLHVLAHPSESVVDYQKLKIVDNQSLNYINGRGIVLRDYKYVMGMSSSLLAMSLLEGASTISVQPSAIGEDICSLSSRGFIPRFTSGRALTKFFKENQLIIDPFKNLDGQKKLAKIVDGSLFRLQYFLSAL